MVLGAAGQSVDNNTLSAFSVGAGNDRVLLVTVSDDLGTDILTATFNGVAMTQIIEHTDTVAVDSIWALKLGSGASSIVGDIVVTSNGGTVAFIGATVFQGVNQTNPVDGAVKGFNSAGNDVSTTDPTAGGSPAERTPTPNVSSAVGNLVFDIFDVFDNSGPTGTQTPGTGQTVLHNVDIPARSAYYNTSIKGGASSVQMSWSSSGEAYIHLALNINAAPAGSLTAALDGSGNLSITDADGTRANVITAVRSGTDLVITDAAEAFQSAPATGSLSNGNKTLTIPLSSVTGAITFNTGGAVDSLTLDLSGGDFINASGIDFNGGDPTVAPGDKLVILGGAQGVVTYNYTNAHDGSIAMSNFGTVRYAGLEPIVNSGSATDIIFNLPATANVVTLGDDTASGNNLSRLSGSTFEQTDFVNPSGSLTINRGNSADTLTVSALPDFNASLTIGTAATPFSALTFAGAITLAADKNLTAETSGVITLSTTNSDLAASGTGGISMTTLANISLVSGSSIGVVNGSLTLIANSAGTLAGNTVGIKVSGASLTSSGSGAILLTGKGGNQAGTGGHHGIHLTSAAKISSTGVGLISLIGTGGVGSNFNCGILLDSAGTLVTSVNGKILLDGTGGAGTTVGNNGIYFVNGATGASLTATGSAQVELIGKAGSGTRQNRGVDIEGSAIVSVVDGDLRITGTSPGTHTTDQNMGVVLVGGVAIPTVSSSGSGKIIINGTGGTGTTLNAGFVQAGGAKLISSGSGDVEITGVSGSGGVANSAFGIFFDNVAGSNITTSAGYCRCASGRRHDVSECHKPGNFGRWQPSDPAAEYQWHPRESRRRRCGWHTWSDRRRTRSNYRRHAPDWRR